jgi:hypothetical protein
LDCHGVRIVVLRWRLRRWNVLLLHGVRVSRGQRWRDEAKLLEILLLDGRGRDAFELVRMEVKDTDRTV